MSLDHVAALGSPIDPDRLTLDAIRDGGLHGRPVTVLGLARSGIALSRFLAGVGADVTVYDRRPREDLARAIAQVGAEHPIRRAGVALVQPKLASGRERDHHGAVGVGADGADIPEAEQLEAMGEQIVHVRVPDLRRRQTPPPWARPRERRSIRRR